MWEIFTWQVQAQAPWPTSFPYSLVPLSLYMAALSFSSYFAKTRQTPLPPTNSADPQSLSHIRLGKPLAAISTPSLRSTAGAVPLDKLILQKRHEDIHLSRRAHGTETGADNTARYILSAPRIERGGSEKRRHTQSANHESHQSPHSLDTQPR